jgi:hypothetical protein
MRKLITPGMLLFLFIAAPLCAQNTEVQLYHGSGNSRTVAYQVGGSAYRPSLQRDLSLSLSEGSRVCVNVLNAYPLLFSYRVASVLDTMPPAAPDLGPFVKILAGFLPKEALAAAHAGAPAVLADAQAQRLVTVIKLYGGNIEALRTDLAQVRQYIVEGALPERFDQATLLPVVDTVRGLEAVKARVRAMRTQGWRFNNPRLAADVEAFRLEQLASFQGNVPDYAATTIAKLNEYSTDLIRQRDVLRQAVENAKPVWRECHTLKPGATTLTLHVNRPQDTTLVSAARDTGQVISVVARTHYARPLVQIAPAAFARYTDIENGYAIRDGVLVTSDPEDWEYRLASMLVINPPAWQFGEDAEMGFSVGLGVGFLGEDKVVSDFFLVPLQFSVRDWVRVGLGWGWSEEHTTLKPGYALNQPVQGTVEKVDDILDTRRKNSFFLLFSLNGLTLR